MGHGVVERIDAPEIVVVEVVLGAGLGRALLAEMRAQQLEHGREHRKARAAELAAARLERRGQLLVDQRIEHHARLAGDLVQDALELPGRTNQRIDVLDSGHALELRYGRPRDRDQRFAGGV